jgi:hypothetical protein
MKLNEGGVSEAIGYIIIFGLVMTGIGLVSLYGYPVLMQQESSANIRNMEQTMIVLQNDMKSLTYKLVPYKETTLRVSGGALMLVDSSVTDETFRIQYNDLDYTFNSGQLRFVAQKENVVISLDNGAVIEREIGTTGSYMLASPRWYLDSYENKETLMVNLIKLSSPMIDLSQTGVGTVRMRHSQTLMPGVTPLPDTRVTITYTPSSVENSAYDYSQAWRNFLTDPKGLKMVETVPGSSNVYTLDGVDNVVVKIYDLIVEEL